LHFPNRQANDLKEPGAKHGLRPKTRRLARQDQKDRLGRILRQMRIPELSSGDGAHPPGMTPDQLGKRIRRAFGVEPQ
jgi:hypothetical protein